MAGRGSGGYLGVTAALLALSSCSAANPPPSDAELAIQAVLVELASDGKPVCVDGRTVGDALSLWRRAALAPQNPKARLDWIEATPLRPIPDVAAPWDASERAAVALRPGKPLSRELAGRVTMIAGRMSMRVGEADPIKISDVITPKGVMSRWWLINRVRSDCAQPYRISNPSMATNVGFISVTVERVGTVYAVRRTATGWEAFAQWTPWLQ